MIASFLVQSPSATYRNNSMLTMIGLWLLLMLSFESSGNNICNDSTWKRLDSALYYGEFQAPVTSEFGDYKVQILKINPTVYDFEFILSSQYDSIEQTAYEWWYRGGFIGVINAGMYHADKALSPVGHLVSHSKTIQSGYKGGFNMWAAFGCNHANINEFVLTNYGVDEFINLEKDYHSYFQSIRMISAPNTPVLWKSKPEKRMSMTVLAMDNLGNVLFIFSRSPMSANEMSRFLISLPLGITKAMYLEGGPEASMYVEQNDFCLQKFGSFVSISFAHDRNDHFWTIPNMLGFKKKQQK